MLSEGISNHLINENYKYGNFSYDLEGKPTVSLLNPSLICLLRKQMPSAQKNNISIMPKAKEGVKGERKFPQKLN